MVPLPQNKEEETDVRSVPASEPDPEAPAGQGQPWPATDEPIFFLRFVLIASCAHVP